MAVSANEKQAALLLRLRRLQIRAKAVSRNDRATLIALIDELTKVRAELVRRAERTDAELKRAAMRATAITAYVRGARVVGRASRH